MNHSLGLCRVMSLTVLLVLSFINQAALPQTEPAATVLGQNRINKLFEANLSDYSVSIYSGLVADKERVIVQLGESHAKSIASQEMGLELLQMFPLRGFEKTLPQSWLGRIGDHLIRANLLYLSSNPRKKLPEGALVLEVVPDLNFDSPRTPSDDSIENIGLEMNARFDDQFILSGSLLTLNSIALSVGLSAIPVQYLTIGKVHWLKSALVFAMLGYAGIQTVGLKHSYLQNDSVIPKWWPWFFPVSYFLINKRNQVMVNNLIMSLESRPDASLIIIVTGSAHMPGIGYSLQTHYNFRRIPLSFLVSPERLYSPVMTINAK